jgi:3-hydroxyacyl-CoA dehydrogenase
MCFANADIPVTIVETSREALDRGLATVSKNYENTVKRGGLKTDDMERRVRLMNGTTDIEAVRAAEWPARVRG